MSQEIVETLGSRIRAFRKSLEISQQDFAYSLGISNTFLSEIESGKTNPRVELLKKIFAMYSISPNYLFLGNDEMNRKVQETLPKVTITEDFIETGDVNTVEELLALIELSAGYKHGVLGLASRNMLLYQDVLLNALAQKKKKAQAETQAEKKAKEDTPDQ